MLKTKIDKDPSGRYALELDKKNFDLFVANKSFTIDHNKPFKSYYMTRIRFINGYEVPYLLSIANQDIFLFNEHSYVKALESYETDVICG